MVNNRLLKITLFVARLMIFSLWVMAAFCTIGLAIIFLAPSLLDFMQFHQGPGGLTMTIGSGEGNVSLEEISQVYILWIYLKAMAELTISYLIIKQVVKIIHSIRQLNTFRATNVHTLRRIGKLCIIWFLIDIPELAVSSSITIAVNIEMGILLAALAAFVLAEIFAEGNKLMEEQKYTI
ncbi:MAG: DUF2975 domain-containing protein [Bacteroidota bacterium]